MVLQPVRSNDNICGVYVCVCVCDCIECRQRVEKEKKGRTETVNIGVKLIHNCYEIITY